METVAFIIIGIAAITTVFVVTRDIVRHYKGQKSGN